MSGSQYPIRPHHLWQVTNQSFHQSVCGASLEQEDKCARSGFQCNLYRVSLAARRQFLRFTILCMHILCQFPMRFFMHTSVSVTKASHFMFLMLRNISIPHRHHDYYFILYCDWQYEMEKYISIRKIALVAWNWGRPRNLAHRDVNKFTKKSFTN